MSLANINRGDSAFVVIKGHRRDDETKTKVMQVISLGPKYITAGEGRHKIKFHRDSGAEVTEYSARCFIYASEAEWLAYQERERLIAKASRLGREANFRSLSNDDLRTIIALLEAA